MSLKPCPFCGGDPVEFRYSGSPCVGCKECIAYLGGEESDLTHAQLAEAWNRRPDQQTVAQLQARVAELEAALREGMETMDAMGDMPDRLIHPDAWRELHCEKKIAEFRRVLGDA